MVKEGISTVGEPTYESILTPYNFISLKKIIKTDFESLHFLCLMIYGLVRCSRVGLDTL